jgi:hypothetical protein
VAKIMILPLGFIYETLLELPRTARFMLMAFWPLGQNLALKMSLEMARRSWAQINAKAAQLLWHSRKR